MLPSVAWLFPSRLNFRSPHSIVTPNCARDFKRPFKVDVDWATPNFSAASRCDIFGKLSYSNSNFFFSLTDKSHVDFRFAISRTNGNSNKKMNLVWTTRNNCLQYSSLAYLARSYKKKDYFTGKIVFIWYNMRNIWTCYTAIVIVQSDEKCIEQLHLYRFQWFFDHNKRLIVLTAECVKWRLLYFGWITVKRLQNRAIVNLEKIF